MVTQWGMSDKLGPVGYDENQQEVFLGHSITQTKNVSEVTAQKIDDEIRRLIEEGHVMARQILLEHRHDLDLMAQALLEHETLNGEEIGAIMRGEPLATVRRDEPSSTGSPPASAARCRPPRGRAAASRRPDRAEPPAGRLGQARSAELERPAAASGGPFRFSSIPAMAHKARQCASPTGTTDSRDWRTRAKSAKRGSALIAFRVPRAPLGAAASTLTRTNLPLGSSGSG